MRIDSARREDQKSGLEGVLGLMRIAQDDEADAQYHRAMPGDQRGEGYFGSLRVTRHELLE